MRSYETLNKDNPVWSDPKTLLALQDLQKKASYSLLSIESCIKRHLKAPDLQPLPEVICFIDNELKCMTNFAYNVGIGKGIEATKAYMAETPSNQFQDLLGNLHDSLLTILNHIRYTKTFTFKEVFSEAEYYTYYNNLCHLLNQVLYEFCNLKDEKAKIIGLSEHV